MLSVHRILKDRRLSIISNITTSFPKYSSYQSFSMRLRPGTFLAAAYVKSLEAFYTKCLQRWFREDWVGGRARVTIDDTSISPMRTCICDSLVAERTARRRKETFRHIARLVDNLSDLCCSHSPLPAGCRNMTGLTWWRLWSSCCRRMETRGSSWSWC